MSHDTQYVKNLTDKLSERKSKISKLASLYLCQFEDTIFFLQDK